MIRAILIQCKISKLLGSFGTCLMKVFLLTGLIFVLIHSLSDLRYFKSSLLFFKHQYHEKDPVFGSSSPAADLMATTNINHIVFVLSGSAKGWQDPGALC